MSKRSIYDIVKLQSFDATEFHGWKLHVQLGMKERGIFYTVLSDFASTTENVSELQWNKDEDYCRDYLLNSLNPSLAMSYSEFETAKEIWDRLKVHSQKQEGLMKNLLAEKFFDFKFNMNSTVTSQLIEMENMRNKLNDYRADMSDNLFVSLILSKLPPEWNTFKTVLHRMEEQIGLDELKNFLHVEDQNSVRKCIEQVSQPTLVANSILHSNMPHKEPPTIKCESSLQLHAKKTSCKKKKGKCHNCGKWGHWAAECRSSKKPNEDAPQNKAHILVNKSEPESFFAMMESARNNMYF